MPLPHAEIRTTGEVFPDLITRKARHPTCVPGLRYVGRCIVATRTRSRELARCDAELRKLAAQRFALMTPECWDPDELACIREDIDQWLDRRLALINGTAR